MFKFIAAAVFIISLVEFQPTEGSGILLDPVSRGARWRYNVSAPIDRNDNKASCGGFDVLIKNNYQCGVCGDNFNDRVPRAHENRGQFGQGVIVKSYSAGDFITTKVVLTETRLGSIRFDLYLDANNEKEEEFYPLRFESGIFRFPIEEEGLTNQIYYPTVYIPSGVRCKNCVLRWTYTTADKIGFCENFNSGYYGKGCGAQEVFKSCSDISITA